VRDFAEIEHDAIVTREVAHAALVRLDVDEIGLDYMDTKLLTALIDKFNGGPAGLDTLAAAIAEERDSIEDVIEPFLLQEGLINRTPRGRVATPLAYAHLKRKLPGNGSQESLL
jgi:holliday junction DNA helicase RuvB